jgi:uncharacterized membrane protein YhaH (DUF805 family)
MPRIFALLSTAALFGGMLAYSFGFAPMMFKALPPDVAGRTLRQAFPWYYLFVIVVAAASAALLFALDPLSAAIMAAVAVVAVYARQGLMPMINAARDRQLGGDASAKAAFGRLHGASVLINFAQLGGVAWVLARLA